MKKLKFGLLPRIALAIILGIALGGIVPAPIVRGVNTFAAVFDQFIKFMVPLIILGLVAPAIAETGRGAGRMLLTTAAKVLTPLTMGAGAMPPSAMPRTIARAMRGRSPNFSFFMARNYTTCGAIMMNSGAQ